MTLSEPILLEFCLLPNRISRFAPQWTCLCAKELDVNQQLACSFQSNPPSKSFNLNIHCKTLHYTSLEAVWQLLDITSAATCIGAYWSYSKLQIESSFIWQSEKGLYQSFKKNWRSQECKACSMYRRNDIKHNNCHPWTGLALFQSGATQKKLLRKCVFSLEIACVDLNSNIRK